jgi:hypothetical protein
VRAGGGALPDAVADGARAGADEAGEDGAADGAEAVALGLAGPGAVGVTRSQDAVVHGPPRTPDVPGGWTSIRAPKNSSTTTPTLNASGQRLRARSALYRSRQSSRSQSGVQSSSP